MAQHFNVFTPMYVNNFVERTLTKSERMARARKLRKIDRRFEALLRAEDKCNTIIRSIEREAKAL